jgi:DNA-binding IclR family transcriptional regulator
MSFGNNSFIARNITPDADHKPTAVRSVYRAVNILSCLSSGINTVTDIARHCKITKPTVFRLLKTLEELLMVVQDPSSHRYYIGPLVNHIASNPLTNHHYLITCALEELQRLWDLTGETVELNIMVGLQYIRLYEIPSRFDLKVVNGPDPVGPIFVGATAKVLLSQLEDEELKTALKNVRIRHITEYSVTDEKELLAQLKEIRNHGYGISLGERILGALCISVPVNDYFWPVALSVVGPEQRFRPLVEQTLNETLLSSKRISNSITDFFRAKGVIDIEQKG